MKWLQSRQGAQTWKLLIGQHRKGTCRPRDTLLHSRLFLGTGSAPSAPPAPEPEPQPVQVLVRGAGGMGGLGFGKYSTQILQP